MLSLSSVGQIGRIDELRERAARIERADHDLGLQLGAVLQRHAGGATVVVDDVTDRGVGDDLGAERLRGACQHLREAAVATLVERPRTEVAVVLAEVVEQQHQTRALRARADLAADDARRREPALDDVAVEVVVEEVGRAAGEQADAVLQHPRRQRLHPLGQIGQLQRVGGIVAEQVGRRRVDQRLQRLAHLRHVVLVLIHRVGVVLAVPGDLFEVGVAVGAHQQVVAVLHRRERAGHLDRHEAVLGQLEIMDDVGAQQAERVRERGEVEPGDQLLGDRRAADDVAPLDDQRLQARLGEVRAVDQAVVAAADDDRVEGGVGRHRYQAVFLGGLNSGGRATTAATVW